MTVDDKRGLGVCQDPLGIVPGHAITELATPPHPHPWTLPLPVKMCQPLQLLFPPLHLAFSLVTGMKSLPVRPCSLTHPWPCTTQRNETVSQCQE